ncbi:diguanylate cyclase [Vibrio crassostreae]|uniref:GGDEF domain-containing protein n=1 Tax=Vibrio TaxID=662 RepID=UPI0005E6176C|nr:MULTISPECIES: sensor domain-containing diguanylate cyclase [Vibrio]NVN81529.1 diguanylate cyclase [Vibrio sp. Scap16]QLE92098.1 diguanylate cyclase [Vibrio sp. Scap24]TCT67532.1 diguanylate cyclase (GGDEF)-like protein [Vibrio crassostreae]TCT87037.1 diguanylate cyclase (GGDEF)-like protein [Vibrio crassostreae]TCU07996.1 diguanylate cyclase (GGDEF)-like protein [Vibrio crassostreae]
MKVNRHFSLTFIFGFPAVIATMLLGLIGKNHFDSVKKDIDSEFHRIEEVFKRTTKVVTALDYSFSNYYKSGNPLFLDHNKQVVDGLCQIWPIDVLLLADGKTSDIPSVDIDYMLVGQESLCSETSDSYKSASEKIALAPILSFLSQLDEYHDGVHFIDTSGYVISSPEDFAKGLSKELLSTIKSRPYWQKTANNPDQLTLSGPGYRFDSLDRMISMTIPVFHKGVHQGMLSVDINAGRLLENSNEHLAGRIDIIDTTRSAPIDSAAFYHEINLEGVASHHAMYYELDIAKEIEHFFVYEKDSLIVAIIVYLFSVTIFFYVNSTIERGYFKELAAKDPMTGLLNRRGLEAFWRSVDHDQLFALTVFDIDDFKLINDTYGHDKGDDVIRYMSRQISNSVRSSDVAARFGGEEFVVYMKGDDRETLMRTLERVKNAISAKSVDIVPNGFTVSGGVCIVETEQSKLNFEEIFKYADEKLYVAKTTGKDRLEF